MKTAALGILFTILFVILEAAQFVYFGGLFQGFNHFYFGFLVFGVISLGCIAWVAVTDLVQLKNLLAAPGALLGINVAAVITFTAYLTSVKLVEPAITYTVSSGTMPITAYVLYRLGFAEGEGMRNGFERWGNGVILVSIIFLILITVLGLSGFVRGGVLQGFLGVFLAVVDGIFFTLIMVYSKRLYGIGAGTIAVLGIRLPLYVLVSGMAAAATWGSGTDFSLNQTAVYVLIGLVLTLPPLYLVQKAVTMISTLTLSSFTALGPLFVFVMQLVEGRVHYRHVTLAGLLIYIFGALIAAYGAMLASTRGESA